MNARTRVFITIDVECAEERLIRGRIQPPLGYDLRVWGQFANHTRGLGIGLIMDELDACGHKATFFVEPFGSHYFGLEGLAAVAQGIRGRGHDVQLHAHPMQRQPAFRSSGAAPLPDDMAEYTLEQQHHLLEEGLALLVAAGVPRTELTAFRAGNFGANNDTWAAMRRAGLRVSSNLNPSYLRRNCRILWPRSEQTLFDTGVGVWELPVSTFVEPGGRLRHLQLAAVSLAELVRHLRQARRLGLADVTLFTHSFELYTTLSADERRGHLSWINLLRLRGLCRYLRRHADEFEVETLGGLARRLPVSTMAAAATPRGSRVLRWQRLLEQGLKRAATGFKLTSNYYS